VTRLSKKDEERRNLDAYLAAAVIAVDDGKVDQAERPDFLLRLDGVSIGVEVTEYHVDGNRREVEEHWASLRQWPMLLNDFPRHRQVELNFRALKLPSRRETHDFVAQLIAVIAGAVDLPANISIDPARWPTLGKYVSRVEVAASTVRYLGWSWNFDIAWIGVTEDELMTIVDAKRSSTVVAASSYWLMITEGATLSRVMALMDHEWLEVMSRLTKQLEDGPFDRLILLQSPIIEWCRDVGWRTIAEQGGTKTDDVFHAGAT